MQRCHHEPSLQQPSALPVEGVVNRRELSVQQHRQCIGPARFEPFERHLPLEHGRQVLDRLHQTIWLEPRTRIGHQEAMSPHRVDGIPAPRLSTVPSLQAPDQFLESTPRILVQRGVRPRLQDTLRQFRTHTATGNPRALAAVARYDGHSDGPSPPNDPTVFSFDVSGTSSRALLVVPHANSPT